jgi:signal transduction histidine kinase
MRVRAAPWSGAALSVGRRRPVHRWVIVAAVFVALVELAQLAVAERLKPPQLGLSGIRIQDEQQLVIDWVQPGGPAWDAGARPGDTLVAVAGPLGTSVSDPATLASARLAQVRSASGRLATVSFESAGLVSDQRRLSFLLVAAWFVIVGGVVFIVATDVVAAGVVLVFATASATSLVAAIGTPFGASWALASEYVALIAFGASAFLLFLVFPIQRLGSRLGRRTALGLLGLHAALVVLYSWVVAFDSAAYAVLQPFTIAVLAADLMGASVMIVLAVARASPARREARRALALVAVGTLAGVGPFCALALGPYLLGMGYLVPPDVAILSLALLPASLGIAVLSRQFLGIDRVVRRGLVALLIWMILLSSYTLGLAALRRATGAGASPLASVMGSPALSITLVAATFWPLQSRLRRELERVLFRDVYSYAQTVQQLGAEVVVLSGVDSIARHVVARLGRTLDLSWSAIALHGGSPLYHWGTQPDGWAERPGELHPLLVALAEDPATPSSPPLKRIVPLVADGATIGLLGVGPKRHDLELSPDDTALLDTVGPLVATALQNALLVRKLEAQVAVLGERERALAALSAELMGAQEEERRRIALDLHDEPLQRTILLAREIGEATASPHAHHWRAALDEIIVSLRAVCAGLRPPALDDFGLEAGLEYLLNDIRARSDLTAQLAVQNGDMGSFGRLPQGVESALYRVAQEALNNCLKHAQAGQVSVVLGRDQHSVRLCVADDGRGPGGVIDGTRTLQLGILGMRERLRPWGGTVTVSAGAVAGTVVSVQIPLRDEFGDGHFQALFKGEGSALSSLSGSPCQPSLD